MLRMKWSPDNIVAIEARAERAGVSGEDLHKAAGAHRTTWSRWKRGAGSPTVAAWGEVLALVEERERVGAPGDRVEATREKPPASKAA